MKADFLTPSVGSSSQISVLPRVAFSCHMIRIFDIPGRHCSPCDTQVYLCALCELPAHKQAGARRFIVSVSTTRRASPTHCIYIDELPSNHLNRRFIPYQLSPAVCYKVHSTFSGGRKTGQLSEAAEYIMYGLHPTFNVSWFDQSPVMEGNVTFCDQGLAWFQRVTVRPWQCLISYLRRDWSSIMMVKYEIWNLFFCCRALRRKAVDLVRLPSPIAHVSHGLYATSI